MTIDFDYSRNPFTGEVWKITGGRRKGGHLTVIDWHWVGDDKNHIRVLTVCDALDRRPYQVWRYKIGYWRVGGTMSFSAPGKAVAAHEAEWYRDQKSRAA